MYTFQFFGAGWSSLAARRAHNPKVVGSNPTPATNNARSRGRFQLLPQFSAIKSKVYCCPPTPATPKSEPSIVTSYEVRGRACIVPVVALIFESSFYGYRGVL